MQDQKEHQMFYENISVPKSETASGIKQQLIESVRSKIPAIDAGRQAYSRTSRGEVLPGLAVAPYEDPNDVNPENRLVVARIQTPGDLIELTANEIRTQMASLERDDRTTDPNERVRRTETRPTRINGLGQWLGQAAGQADEALAAGDIENAFYLLMNTDLIQLPGYRDQLREIAGRYQQTGSDNDRELAIRLSKTMQGYVITRPEVLEELRAQVADAAKEDQARTIEAAERAVQDHADQAKREAEELQMELCRQNGRRMGNQILRFKPEFHGTGVLREADNNEQIDIPGTHGVEFRPVRNTTTYLTQMRAAMNQALQSGNHDAQSAFAAHLTGFADEILDRVFNHDKYYLYDMRIQQPFDGKDIQMLIDAYDVASPTGIDQNLEAMQNLDRLRNIKPELRSDIDRLLTRVRDRRNQR